MKPSSSFTVQRANSTTWCIKERDKYREHPLIYAKVHPAAPIIILSDTGCDAPADEYRDADFIHLRHLLEEYPIEENGKSSINPGGKRTYVIILTHCHYDHIGGISQFLVGGKTQIIASAAGRDFIESDLPNHSLCKQTGISTPEFKVTHWAQTFERLTWPLQSGLPGDQLAASSRAIDLDIDILHTPGHTPDELAWADRAEKTIYVGDSFYQLGEEAEPIVFPPQGNMIEWNYSLGKIADYIIYELGGEPESALDDDSWTMMAQPVKLSAAHVTINQPAVNTFMELIQFIGDVLEEKTPALFSDRHFGELYTYWSKDIGNQDPRLGMALWCPQRLVDDVKRHFGMTEGRGVLDPMLLRTLQQVNGT